VSLEAWLARGLDRTSRVADPLFVDWKAGNFALRPESPAFGLGFKSIDTRTIGLLHDRCRCAIRPACPDFGL
jgi:hypothetical protein